MTPRLVIAGLALCALVGSPARAHMPTPGAEGFYLGVTHPFVTPSHLLLILALSVMIGGFEIDRLRELLGAFLLAMAAGLLEFGGYFTLHEAMLTTAIACAVLAALAPGRLWLAAVALVCFGGFLFGVMALDRGDVWAQLTVAAGTVLGANLGLLFFSAGMDWIKEKAPWHWVAIAFRVAAAWVGAIALLLLALLFSPGGGA